MKGVCLHVLVGIPGAGKTTYCQRIQEYLNVTKTSFKAIHICFDDFIKFDAAIDLENSSFRDKRKRFLELLEQFIQALNIIDFTNLEQINNVLHQEFNNKIAINVPLKPSRYLILIDDNMYYRSMRYQMFQIARRLRTGYFQTFFCVSLETAIARNRERANPVPEEVISRMFYKLEKPDESICRWETNTITLNNCSQEIETILNQAIKCLENPVPPLETNLIARKTPVEQSLVHKVDLALRIAVGEMINRQKELLNGDDLKLFAEGLLSKRKLLLEDLRAGTVEINPESITSQQLKAFLL